MNRIAREAPPWSSLVGACSLVVRGRTARTALPVALFVGTVLSLVNEGGAVIRGQFTIGVVARVVTNYVVPFCVASFGYLATSRTRPSDRGSAPD